MTNKQIIRAAAERLDPATLHQIATARHTPEEIAAVAASCKIVDKDGNEKPATAADIEIMFAADELHTFDFWKKEGKSVKKGEKALLEWLLICAAGLNPCVTPSRQTSAFARVYAPMPQKFVLLFRFFLIHTKAQVLYSNPHASMTRRASAICGNVAHMKHTDPPPQVF